LEEEDKRSRLEEELLQKLLKESPTHKKI